MELQKVNLFASLRLALISKSLAVLIIFVLVYSAMAQISPPPGTQPGGFVLVGGSPQGGTGYGSGSGTASYSSGLNGYGGGGGGQNCTANGTISFTYVWTGSPAVTPSTVLLVTKCNANWTGGAGRKLLRRAERSRN